MEWTQLWFGKYKGKTLPQVIFSDPDWFFYMMKQKAFENKGVLREEAEEIYSKACNIRIPSKGGEGLIAEYAIHPVSGKFCDLEVVSKDKPRHEGSTTVLRKNVIDLSFPVHFANYDKLGCKLLLRSMKLYIFESKDYRLTKARCEEFFNENDNFVLNEGQQI
jgi:hypothetical protein